MITHERADFINEQEIEGILAQRARPAPARVRELLAKAREMRGLSMDEVACLSFVESPELLQEIFSTAKQIKEEIYGSRLVFFAPLYISNRCANECTYCAFRATNSDSQAPHADAGRDCGRDAHPDSPGTQAGSDGLWRSAAAAGLSIHSRLHRDHLRRHAWVRARSGASM